MKKQIFSCLLFFLSVIFCIVAGVHFFSVGRNSHVTINVYNWGEYISDGTGGTFNANDEFTRRTGIHVNYNTFQSNEALFAKIQNGGAKYDVIIPSDYMVSKMIDKGMLKKLDFEQIPNFCYIDNNLKKPEYDPQNEYSVPYAWGVIGIFYNKTMVSEPKERITWDILWDPEYSGRILMFDNPRDAFAIAQMRLGIPINTANPCDWECAADELRQQRPLVQSYVMDQIFDKMGSGEAALAPYYSGDAALLAQSNPDIGFVIPKGCTVKFVDAMCIPKGCEHPDEAQQYINFMCNPEIAKQNIQRIGYSSPIAQVQDQLKQDVDQHDEETIHNAKTFTALPDEVMELIDNLWVSIKTGESGNPFILVTVLLMFFVTYLIVLKVKKTRAR